MVGGVFSLSLQVPAAGAVAPYGCDVPDRGRVESDDPWRRGACRTNDEEIASRSQALCSTRIPSLEAQLWMCYVANSFADHI